MASFQGKIWVAGGCNAWNAIRSVEIYDPLTNSWKEGPSLSTPRRGCGLAVHQGHLIVVGGSDGTHSLCTTGLAATALPLSNERQTIPSINGDMDLGSEGTPVGMSC